MYISHQPSGGRGEFELAGESGGISATDLVGVGFRLNAGPFGIRETELMLSEQGGKRRLRTTTSIPHIQRQVAALALLPESTRDASKVSGGRPVVIAKRYVIDQMHLRSIDLRGGMATIELGQLVLTSNHVGEPSIADRVLLPERLSRVKALHDRANELPSAVGSALNAHRDALQGNGPIGTEVEQAVRRLVKALADPEIGALYIPRTDPLPALEALLGITEAPVPPQPTETASDEVEIKRRETSILRLQRARGASAARFRKAVQAAYRYTCVICGITLPAGTICARPGVDAAHILPYGDYDLDIIQNGLCLCKIHHWAFDEQILIVRFKNSAYRIDVSPRGHAAFGSFGPTMRSLQAVEGTVPVERLPTDTKQWPSSSFLEQFYADVPPVGP